jgi:hypothetical protein
MYPGYRSSLSQDLQHHLFLLTVSGHLYLAPIKDLPTGVHNVLDIATGTGIWAIEFGTYLCPIFNRSWLLTTTKASEFPSANVIGIDLSPIQPELYVEYFSRSSAFHPLKASANLSAFHPTATSKSTMQKTRGHFPANSTTSTAGP